jgi:cell division protein FtsL
MHKLFNAALILTALISGFVLYSLEHSTRALERQIATLQKQIVDSREDAKLLNAEWSSLTRPDRLRQLAEQHLKLQPLAAQQIVKLEELGQGVPQEPVVKLEAKDQDPIGAILQKMQ